MIRKPIQASRAFVSGSILVRVELDTFLELTMENSFVILHGQIRSTWSALQRGHHYFATDGRITYYTVTEQPLKQIEPNIEAADFDVQSSPAY